MRLFARVRDDRFAPTANGAAMLAEVEVLFADLPSDGVRHRESPLGRPRRDQASPTRGQPRRRLCLASDRRYPGQPAVRGLAAIAVLEGIADGVGRTAADRCCCFSSALTTTGVATTVRVRRRIGISDQGTSTLASLMHAPAIARIKAPRGAPSCLREPDQSLYPSRFIALRMDRPLRPNHLRPNAGGPEVLTRACSLAAIDLGRLSNRCDQRPRRL